MWHPVAAASGRLDCSSRADVVTGVRREAGGGRVAVAGRVHQHLPQVTGDTVLCSDSAVSTTECPGKS